MPAKDIGGLPEPCGGSHGFFFADAVIIIKITASGTEAFQGRIRLPFFVRGRAELLHGFVADPEKDPSFRPDVECRYNGYSLSINGCIHSVSDLDAWCKTICYLAL